MSDDFREMLRSGIRARTQTEGLPNPNLTRVVVRGNQLERRRRAGLAIISLALSALVVVVLVFVQSPLDVGRVNRPSGGGFARVQTHRVASFAIRAAANAGLLDTNGEFADYEATNESEADWTVSFNSFDCHKRPQSDGRCTAFREMTLVTVESDAGKLVVTDVQSPFSEEIEGEIRRYSEKPEDKDNKFGMPDAAIQSSGESPAIVGTYYWSGPIPSPGYVGFCRAELFNSSGDRLEKTSAFQLQAPQSEAMRSGSVKIVELPLATAAQSVTVECRTVQMQGWKPVGKAEIQRHEGEFCRGACFDGDRFILVTTRLVWEGPVSPGLLTECQVSVRDVEDQIIGRESTMVAAARSEGERDLEMVVETPDATAAQTAHVTCAPG